MNPRSGSWHPQSSGLMHLFSLLTVPAGHTQLSSHMSAMWHGASASCRHVAAQGGANGSYVSWPGQCIAANRVVVGGNISVFDGEYNVLTFNCIHCWLIG